MILPLCEAGEKAYTVCVDRRGCNTPGTRLLPVESRIVKYLMPGVALGTLTWYARLSSAALFIPTISLMYICPTGGRGSCARTRGPSVKVDC